MEEIKKLRSELDSIDAEILKLLMKRTIIVKKIGSIKKRFKIPVVNKKREREVYNNVKEFAIKHGLNPDQIKSIFREILKFSKEVQSEILD